MMFSVNHNSQSALRVFTMSAFFTAIVLASSGAVPVQAASTRPAKAVYDSGVIVRPAHVAPYAAKKENTKRVAFMWDGSWLVLHGLNGYTASKGIPTKVTDALDKANADSKEIKDVAFTADDNWVVITGRNALYASADFSEKAYTKLSALNDKGEDIKFISFMDDGSYAIVWGDNGYSSLGVPDDLTTELDKINNASEVIKDIAFVTTASTDSNNPSAAWLVLIGTNAAVWSKGVPTKLVEVLKKKNANGDSINSAAFASDGNWVLLANDNDATYTLDLPGALITELKLLAGDTSP